MIFKKQMTPQETSVVVKAMHSHLEGLERLLHYFDDRDDAECAAKNEIKGFITSIRLKLVALMCTKNIPSDPAPVPSPTLSEECQEKR